MAAPVSCGGRVPVPPYSVSSLGSLNGGLASSSTVPAGRSTGPPPGWSEPVSRSGFVISCSFLIRPSRRCDVDRGIPAPTGSQAESGMLGQHRVPEGRGS